MAIKVKTLDKQYFDEACSGEPIYGTLQKYVKGKWTTYYVYLLLGKEVEYEESPNDDQKTEYKKFINCTVELARNLEDLEANPPRFLTKDDQVIIVLYH